MPETKLGVAKADITPRKPLPLAGLAHREGDFEGISHRLHARVLFFEQAERSGKRRALLVSADLIWWGTDRMRNLRRRLEERWGLNEDSVILHATHTHSGPQTSARFTSKLGSPDPDYPEEMESNVLAAVDRAAGDLETITVEQGRGECRIGINRRKRVGDEIVMAPNESGPTDPEVGVFRFRTEAGKTKAILVHYACHPTTTDDNLVSSEYPGVAMELVENELGEEVVAAYLQGCCGDIRPALTRGGDFYRGSDTEVRRLGGALANEVLRVLNRPMKVLPPRRLAGRYITVSLPFQELPSRDDLEAKEQQSDLAGEWSRLLRREPERVQPSMPLEMSLVNIADGLSILAINGEVVVDYGLFVKQRFGGRVLPVPYSNGMIGYVPADRQVIEGGYEAKESTLYFGLPAPFAPGLESKIHDGMVSLVEDGFGGGRQMSSSVKPIKRESVDRLRVQVYEDRTAMGAAAGTDVAEKVKQLLSQKERVRMVFAAGPSQNEALDSLSRAEGFDWSRITVFHMDEYVGLSRDDPRSLGWFLRDSLLDSVKPGEVHLIEGTNPAEEECERYAALIQAAPIDIVCLGIGENGHIAFNDPPVADFDDPKIMKPVELDEASRQQQVNDGLFPSINEVPTHALTLTVPALISGTHLFCSVPGPTKRDAVLRALRGPVSTECPSSILRRHPDCTLYVDTAAYDG